jgi:hypothetical protein
MVEGTSGLIRIITIVLIPHSSLHYAVGQSYIIFTPDAACYVPSALNPPCPRPLTLQTHILNEHASTFGEVLVVVTLSEIHITYLPACRCNLFTRTVAHHHILYRNICSMHSRTLNTLDKSRCCDTPAVWRFPLGSTTARNVF